MIDRFPVPSLARRCWRPSADLYRTTHGWWLKLELAGVRPEDVQIHVQGRWLLVTGTRRDLVLDGDSTCQALEISYDSFERRFEFPLDLAAAKITPDFQNGMLLVRIERPSTDTTGGETAPSGR